MKNKKLALVFPAAVIAILMLSVSVGLAGGGINHKVKVYNEGTCNNVEVTLEYGTELFGTSTKTHSIPPHSHHTFETGAKCPTTLRGQACGGNIVTRCINGLEESPVSCGHGCWSSDWYVKRYSSGEFHFEREN